VPDSNAAEFNTVTQFTYVYGGSPGAGVIPLVSGGGTAAQAATATQVALGGSIRRLGRDQSKRRCCGSGESTAWVNVFITSGSIHILNMTEKALSVLASKCRADSVRNFCFLNAAVNQQISVPIRKVADENQLQLGVQHATFDGCEAGEGWLFSSARTRTMWFAIAFSSRR